MPWQRRSFSGGPLARALNIEDLRTLARARVPHFAFEYVEGGAEDERTLAENRRAFGRWQLVPRTLVDVSARHTRHRLFGQELPVPLLIAPTGLNGVLRPRADLELARAAAAAGIPFTVSTFSTSPLAAVAAVGGRLWWQLYVMHERRIARELIARAAAAGCEALVFTTDANVFGSREWDRRNYRGPGRPGWRATLDALRHPRWLAGLARHGMPRFRNLEDFLPPGAASAVGGSTLIPDMLDPAITWRDLEWLRSSWKGKLLVKGVLSAADARLALAAGCDGIVLSNHGGRQLDGCVAPLEVLPEVARAVGGRLTLLIDSGFRRGSDVVKALALGADGVMLGRATLYGVAAGGEAGAGRALEILRTEIERVLGLLGCASIADLSPQLVRRVPAD
ncbi:MAG: alpha-hydroxy-acid oxidizing protein [Gammaproteobacteria bacterium]|nr:alpha-hydroxy-acid oxidizing protein [Gammaproteobacteria bacterium]MBV9696610.1 alpha-hydroxy-acid oxidizing protein [Gammaproteobacteria bacterium]